MGVRPTTMTAETLGKVSGSDNVWSVDFAICKVNDFPNVSRQASQPTRRRTVTQPAAFVQPNRQTAVTIRACAVCGALFVARTAEVRRGNAKCCSRACASNKGKPHGLSRTATRRRARQIWMSRHGGVEPICHCGLLADVHHRDGDPLNNADDNHEPLCRSHHMQHENRVRQERRSAA